MEDDNNQKKYSLVPRKNSRLVEIESPMYTNPIPVPESPEAAIGRRSAPLAVELLKNYARDRTSQLSNMAGLNMVDSYIDKLSPEKRAKLSGFDVSVKRMYEKRFFRGDVEKINISIEFEFDD